MWLFRNFFSALLSLTIGSAFLSALDIPIELPSGSMIHLNVKTLEIDPDSYSIFMETTIKDPKELQLFSENPAVLDLMRQSLEEKWELHDCTFQLKDPNAIKREKPSVFRLNPLQLNPPRLFPPSDRSAEKRELPGEGKAAPSSGSVSRGPSTNPRADALPSRASHPSNESNQDVATKQPIFTLSFSTKGNVFGGDWRATPYELRFIEKQSAFRPQGYTRDNIEVMVVVVDPDRCGFYHKQYNDPNFFPLKSTVNTLTSNLDGTFTFNVPSKGSFLFNSGGQLIYFLKANGDYSNYDYSNGKLMKIQHVNGPELFFEYEGKDVRSISGLPHKIYLEYDEQGHLSRMVDEQGSFLCFLYDKNDGEIDQIVDDAGTVLFGDGYKKPASKAREDEGASFLFNGLGEVFYYKDSHNNFKISYRINREPKEDEDD